MPISGSKFANQVAICKHLLSCQYQPDVILGTSGGCITGALLLASDIGSIKCRDTYRTFCKKMDAILEDIESKYYLEPWSEFSPINTVMAIGNGSLYKRGQGTSFVDISKIDITHQPELWMGTHCKDDACHQLFCSKSRKHSIINLKDARYLNNKVSEVLQVTVASSAVPTIVPAVKIGKKNYCDGGISYASPLGSCMPAYDHEQLSYHVVYICAVRYSSKDDPLTNEIEDDDVWSRISSSYAGMVTGLHIPDRNNGIRAVGPNAIKKKGTGKEFLKKCLSKQNRARRSFIELAPLKGVHINFLTMEKGDALCAVNEAYSYGFSVRHWYVM